MSNVNATGPDPASEPRPTDLRTMLRAADERLGAAGVPTPRLDAELLASHLLAVTLGDLRARVVTGSLVPTAEQQQFFAELVTRRAHREPLQHLTGTAPFRRVELAVGPGVFIPRPETEIVAQVAIDAAATGAAAIDAATGDRAPARVVDLCTGSGAIALAVADEVPTAQIWAVELDAQAHAWAQRNLAPATGSGPQRPGGPVVLVHADARTALRELDGTIDVVVSNPPYVPSDAIPREPEVARHDPPVALYGLGADGLEVPRGIAAAAARLLRPGGVFVMEHAEVQGAAAREMLTSTGLWRSVRTLPDLTGRERMVVAVRTDVVPSVRSSTGPVKDSAP